MLLQLDPACQQHASIEQEIAELTLTVLYLRRERILVRLCVTAFRSGAEQLATDELELQAHRERLRSTSLQLRAE